MNKIIRVLHTEWSDGWGGQEIRIISEMIAVRETGIEVFLACRDHSIIKQKAQEKNIKVFALSFKGNADIKTLFNLIKIIKENGIKIVNTHSGKDTWVGGIAAKLSNAKFIRTRHLSNPIHSSRLNFINELADYIFTTGEIVRLDMIKNNRISPDRIMSIPTGIDINIYNQIRYDRKKCRDYYNLKDEQVVIGTVGVLRKFKRHDRFLLMVRHVIDQNPRKNIHILIAGDGPQKDSLTNMIDEMDLNRYISMLGHIDNVPELLQALDIFVFTSDSGEGVPQAVAQALLMETAVISTNVGGINDLYNNENFVLINNDEQDLLNLTCDNLLKDNLLRESFAKKSRKYVSENFSVVKMSEKIIKIYKDIM